MTKRTNSGEESIIPRIISRKTRKTLIPQEGSFMRNYRFTRDMDAIEDSPFLTLEERSRALLDVFKCIHGIDELGRSGYVFEDSVFPEAKKARAFGSFLELVNDMRESDLPKPSYETSFQRQIMEVVTNGLGWDRDVYTSAVKKIRGNNYDTGTELKAHLERMKTGNRHPINSISKLRDYFADISKILNSNPKNKKPVDYLG